MQTSVAFRHLGDRDAGNRVDTALVVLPENVNVALLAVPTRMNTQLKNQLTFWLNWFLSSRLLYATGNPQGQHHMNGGPVKTAPLFLVYHHLAPPFFALDTNASSLFLRRSTHDQRFPSSSMMSTPGRLVKHLHNRKKFTPDGVDTLWSLQIGHVNSVL